MAIAERAAKEVDRLVLGVNRGVAPAHGQRLQALAAEVGLEDLPPLSQVGDLLLDGLLTREVAVLRMRYRPQHEILGRLEQLETIGLIQEGGSGYVAGGALRPLLKAMAAARSDIARQSWNRNEVEVSIATEAARTVVDAITEDQVVANAHRQTREPLDRYGALLHRLTTLRYMRQHDHALAWIDRDLSASGIVLMSALWRGKDIEADEADLAALREAEYVKKSDPPQLTARGEKTRQAIEDDTNVRNQRAFDTLDGDEAERFLRALQGLPD